MKKYFKYKHVEIDAEWMAKQTKETFAASNVVSGHELKEEEVTEAWEQWEKKQKPEEKAAEQDEVKTTQPQGREIKGETVAFAGDGEKTQSPPPPPTNKPKNK